MCVRSVTEASVRSLPIGRIIVNAADNASQLLLPSATDPTHSAAAVTIRRCLGCGSGRPNAGARHEADADAGRTTADTGTGTAAANHPSPTGALPAGSGAAGDAVCMLEPVIVG